MSNIKPKKIINSSETSVDEMIEGLLIQYPNKLSKLKDHRVILAAKRSPSQVHLISGGGSGHEPSHAGWCGSGMLSAAVCGGIFASPSVYAVLAAIRAVDTEQGVLLVIKNYTGDRLNFGMAAERANQEGLQVQTVVVADDCALPRTKGITGARGVAGTVLVHKIAGSAAATGKTLDDIVKIAKLVCSRMGTLGIALDAVTVPGADVVNDRLDASTIEIGLGIHGEAGMRQSSLLSADDMAREMITRIQEHGREENGNIVPMFSNGDEVVVLVNNLGGTSNFEMSILTKACVRLLESTEFGVTARRVMVGSYMTSFDMHGASLTILNVTGQTELLELLDFPTNAPAWHDCDAWQGDEQRPSLQEISKEVVDSDVVELSKPPVQIADFAEKAKGMIKSASIKLSEAEPLLTRYDTIVGDGDCGITMKRGADEVNKRLSSGSIPTEHPVPLFGAIADAVSASMGGTSGILIELFFRKMSSSLARCKSIGVIEMSQAFQAGVDAIILYGGAQVGSRTMLDALVPAAQAFVTSQDLSKAAAKAQEGADATARMTSASAGRSNYLSAESLKDTPDPGAVAVHIVLDALSK